MRLTPLYSSSDSDGISAGLLSLIVIQRSPILWPSSDGDPQATTPLIQRHAFIVSAVLLVGTYTEVVGSKPRRQGCIEFGELYNHNKVQFHRTIPQNKSGHVLYRFQVMVYSWRRDGEVEVMCMASCWQAPKVQNICPIDILVRKGIFTGLA